MSSRFPGFNTVAGATARPARKRFTTPQAIYTVYDHLKTEDTPDATRRAKIRDAVEGALPYSKAQLKAKGLSHMTNLNFYGLKGTIDARADAITKLGSDTCDLVELIPLTDGSAGPNDMAIGDVIAHAFSTALRTEGHTIPAIAMMNRESDMYGIGPVTWPDDDDFAPVAIERGQVKFRGDGPAVSTDHDFFMIESELPASYLFALLDNEDLAREEGWDIEVLKRLLVSVFSEGVDISNDSSSIDGLSPIESQIVRYKTNTFYEVHQFDTFKVIHVYVREMKAPRGVTHIIIPGSDIENQRFLYVRENAYDTMDQCFLWFPASVSAKFAKELRGIASALVPIERMSDRLTGALIDSAFRAAKLTLQQTTPGANPTVSLSESGTTTIVAAGLEPVPNANASANLQAITGVRQFISQLGVGGVAGAELAPLSTGVKVAEGGKQMSKAEAEIQERRRTQKDENLFNQRVGVLDKVFAECFRRFMKIVNGPSVIANEVPCIRAFMTECMKQGVTPEMLREIPERFAVATCRDLVLGSDGKYSVLAEVLGLAAGDLDEQGRKNAVHDMIRLRLGRRAADRYCPVQGRESMPSDQASAATTENFVIKGGGQVLVGADQLHWSHIPVHAQVLQEIQQTVQQGLAEAQTYKNQGQDVDEGADGKLAPVVDDPERLAQILEATSRHIQEHLAIGGKQLGMKAKAAQVTSMIRGLADTIQALNLAIATQRRVREAEEQKRQRELEAAQNAASEAEMRKALAKVQADKEVGLARVQADKEVGIAKVQAERELNVGKLANDREHRQGQLGIETATARARAENDAATVRAGIETRRRESEANIETAQRESAGRVDAAREGATAKIMSSFSRTRSVTGRERVSPAEIAAQAPTPIMPEGTIPL